MNLKTFSFKQENTGTFMKDILGYDMHYYHKNQMYTSATSGSVRSLGFGENFEAKKFKNSWNTSHSHKPLIGSYSNLELSLSGPNKS